MGRCEGNSKSITRIHAEELEGLRSPEAHWDAEGAPDTCSKGRASTKRQTMPVGTLYTPLSIGPRRIDNGASRREIPRASVKSDVYLAF